MAEKAGGVRAGGGDSSGAEREGAVITGALLSSVLWYGFQSYSSAGEFPQFPPVRHLGPCFGQDRALRSVHDNCPFSQPPDAPEGFGVPHAPLLRQELEERRGHGAGGGAAAHGRRGNRFHG